MESKPIDINNIQLFQREFVRAREWDQYHTPKNLAMALAVESSELLEIFQWLSEDQAQKIMTDTRLASKVSDEVADVFFYLARLADVLHLDIETCLWQKMEKNAQKYPVELARGNAKKYTEFAADHLESDGTTGQA